MKKKSLLLILLMTLLAPWAVAQTALLEENFDAMTSIATSYSETDWFAYNAGSGNNWMLNTSSSYAHSGSNSALYNYSSSYNADCYLVSSPFDVSAKMDELNISLYERVRNTSYAETFEVFLVKASDVKDAAGVVSATHYAAIASASYTNATYAEATGNNSDAALAGQSVRLVVHCTSVADKWALYIDDITVTETQAEACPKPKNLEATNITDASATLTWTTSETPSNGFNVRYRTAEDPNASFFENFDEGSIPSTWTIYTDGDAPQSDGWYATNPQNGLGFDAHSGNYCASAWSWSTSSYDADNWLITPQVTFNKTLKFWVRTNTGYPDSYEVLLSTTGKDEADFTVELQAMAAAPTTGEWEEVTIDLTAYTGEGYIAIHHVSNDMNYLLIDDFGLYGDAIPAGTWTNTTSNTNSKDIAGLTELTLYEFEVQSNCGGETSSWVASTFTTNPSCMPVANLAVSDVTTTTVTLTWTDQNSGSASYIVTDNDDNPVTVTNLTITGCTVTGLTANTAYTFKVKADCGSTAEPINVRTDCNALTTLPYEEGFEASSVNIYCWDLVEFGRINNNTYAHTGNVALYSQTTSVGYAILPATTTNISELMLNFWWQNNYSGYDLGTLEIGYLTDAADYSTFVNVGTIDMSSSSDTYAITDDYVFDSAPAGARIALKYTPGTSGSLVFIDDVTVDVKPNCLKPSDLAATANPDSAELSWTANNGETSWNLFWKKSSDTDYTLVKNLTDNPYTLTPLDSNTQYEYYVEAICSSTETSDPSNVYSFKTPCGASFPYEENFESLTAGTVPDCWDNTASTVQEITSNPAYVWGVYEYNSNKMIRMYNYFVHTGIALINSPQITLPADACVLVFEYAHNASCGDFIVKISEDGGTTFTDLKSYSKGSGSSYSDPGTFTEETIQLAAYSNKTIVLQFYAEADYGNGAIFVDNVKVQLAPNCLKPTEPSAAPSTTSAVLSWTANSSETAWTIFYKKTSDTDYTSKNVTENPYNLTGLDSSTDYEYYVVANCSSTETSEPSVVFYFSTECEPITITAASKYTQDFESPVVTSTYSSTTDLKVPNCWENPYTSGSSAAGKPHLIAKGSSYNYSTDQVLNFYGSGNNYVTLPEFTNDLQDLQISFKWATESSSNGTLTLGYITDGDVNYNTFTEISGASYPASSSSYRTLIQADPVDLSTLPTTAKRLAFRWVYSGQYSCNVDDLVVELIPSCKIPTGLTCTDYTATTATFDWTGNGTNQPAWQLYISDQNIAPAFDIDEKEVINVTTKPYTVPGLTAETTYYAWVRGNCTASSEGYSEWSDGIEFTPSAYKNFTYNETASSNTGYLPIYGSYTNNATNKGQMLIPASAFPAEMVDATVRRLTFYTTSSYANVTWGDAEFDVLVTEVDATSFETAAFFEWTDMTTVYSGKLSVVNNEMVINLDAPFSYTGGNLVIGFDLTTTGTNQYVNWMAYYGSTYLGTYQYGTSSVSRTSYQPKTTFNYLPNPTPRPINPHATEELSHEATLAWTAPNSTEVTGYQYQYKVATATEWPTALTDETGLTANITGLTPETTYDFRVRAVYPGPTYSQYAETQFTTTAACVIPTGLTASNITMNTADLTWNASSEVASYTMQIRTAAQVSPIDENFESGSMPTGWTVEGDNQVASKTWRVGVGDYSSSTGTHSGNFNALITHNTSNNVTYLVTPSMDLSAITNGKIHLWYINRNYSGDIDEFGIYYRIDGGAWTEIFATTSAHATWTEFDEAIPAGALAANCQIGFKAVDHFGYGVALDDITIGETVPEGTWATTSGLPNTGTWPATGLAAGIKYDVRVYAVCASDPETENTMTSFTTLANGNKVFTNAAGDGKWNTADNWVPSGAPTITENAVIRTNVNIFGNATAKKITFEGSTTPVLTIENGGTLQTDNTVTATVKKHIDGYTAAHEGESVGFYLIANPLNSFIYSSGLATAGLTNGNYDFYSWSYTADKEWLNYKNSSFSSMATQTGYLYANEADTDLAFTGTVIANNTDVTKSLNYATSGTYDLNGWNLVGNPFVCDAYITLNDNSATEPMAYYRMKSTGDGFEASTAPVKPTEGIFVTATASGQSVKFSRTAPVTGFGNGQLNISLEQVVNNRDERPATDNAIVRFDGGNDLEKFMFSDDNAKLYIPQDGNEFAVVKSEGQGTLPVNLKVTKTSNYTISFSNENMEFAYLHLIDNFTGEDIDLLIDESYTFMASVRDNEARFTLVFNAFDSNIDITSDIFAYQNGDEIIVSGQGELQVYDVMGRFVMSTRVNGTERINAASLSNAVYIFRLVGNEVKTQKIVVR